MIDHLRPATRADIPNLGLFELPKTWPSGPPLSGAPRRWDSGKVPRHSSRNEETFSWARTERL